MKKSIQEITAAHGAKAAALLTSYYDELDAIREQRKPEAGAYLEHLTDGQRFSLLMEQKTERANAAHRRTLDAYRREMDRYQEEVRARVGYVKGALFGLSSPESAALLSRAATATEEELGAMVDLAEASGNGELARAALIGADRRGFAELRVRALEHAGPEAQALYGEWAERPPEEVLERQRETVEQIVAPPDPDRLAGTPLPNAY
ncbi:MAG: hypothetical protein M3Q49_09820 [Actinomycetota bacterium]|nr:hypothetical protein [Actinomycetota bacterium]